MNNELLTYIESKLKEEVPKEIVHANLVSKGWPVAEIEKAFLALEQKSAAEHVPAPAPTPAPASAKEAENTVVEPVALKKSAAGFKPGLVIGVVVVLILVSGAAYGYLSGLFSFDKLPYSEDNLVSGIAASAAEMKTFTYSMSGELKVEDREVGATPFVFDPSADKLQLQKKYERDYERFNSVMTILSAIKYGDTIPKDLAEISEWDKQYNYRAVDTYTIDPLTNKEFKYEATEDNFKLEVVFETKYAIDEIKDSYLFTPLSTVIDEENNTVVFTKSSSANYYISLELPKPFYEKLNQMMVYLPPELYFKAGISATTDFTEDKADWAVSLDAEGDFGDLIYKVAGDVTKKDSDFYFRIRNLPSLFLGMFAYEKGEWFRFSEEWIDENKNITSISVPTYLIPDEDEEQEYKENREIMGNFLRRTIEIADEEKVLVVKNTPMKEVKNNKDLYRYDVRLNKESLLPFVERVVAESQKEEVTRELDLANDTALVDYLQSAEFDAIFDYYENNTALTFWVNKQGFIEVVEYSIRVVPPDEATTLKDKQAKLTITLGFDNINQPVNISAPAEYRDIDEYISEAESSFSAYGLEGPQTSNANDSIKSDLDMVSFDAMDFYLQSNSYVGVCEYENIQYLFRSIEETIGGDGLDDDVVCMDGRGWYVIQAPLVDPEPDMTIFWCVDSEGHAESSNTLLSEGAQSCSP